MLLFKVATFMFVHVLFFPSHRIQDNNSASALTGQFKPGRGNQTLIISPWISILHRPLLCKRFVSDEVTSIYNSHHQCLSYMFIYPGRVSIMLIYCIANHRSHEECDSEYETKFLVACFHV